jgi:hypothetical protein
MKSLIQKLLILSLLVLLNACGGGAGGDDHSTSGEVKSLTIKTFSLSLSSVDIRRVSNGEMIVVDSSSISSGTLNLNQ